MAEEDELASWDDVDVDFGGDETGNFGPRLESGTSLYEVNTVATISPRGKVVSNPQVFACVTDKAICVSAGCHVSLFDGTGHQFLITLAFESDIDVSCWSPNSDFLILGERNGTLHFIHSQSREPVFSQTLVPDSDGVSFQQIEFMSRSEAGWYDLLVLTSNKTLFRFRRLHLEALNEAILAKDEEAVKSIQSQMKTDTIDTSDTHSESSSYVRGLSKGFVTCGYGDSVISVWMNEDTTTPVASIGNEVLKGAGILLCKPTQCEKYLLALDDKHMLSLWCTFPLCLLKVWPELRITDFKLMEDSGKNNSLKDVKLLILTEVKDGQCFLQMLSMKPDFEVLYSLQLYDTVFLTEISQNQDGIFLLEGVHSEDEDVGLLSSLRVRCLTEAQPETRFYRLLHKNQFQEAETFAKTFGLDVELVHRVKSQHILDQLSPWNVSSLSTDQVSELYNQLRECFELIKDNGHIVECCVNAAMPTFDMTREMLNLARTRLNANMSVQNGLGDENISLPDLMSKVSDTLYRLQTYQATFGLEEYSGNHWEAFKKSQMLFQVLKLLQKGKVSCAFTIWNRHSTEFEAHFTLDVIKDILSSIPEQTTAKEIMPWMCQEFLPFVIRLLPEGLNLVAEWLEQKARNMELLEKDDWPRNALKLAEVFVSASSEGESQVETQLTQSFPKLKDLIVSLEDLYSLHTRYKCKLSLAEYTQENTESITYRMLDKVVAVELIPHTITQFVRPYMKEHGLKEDQMLYQYIQDLLARCGHIQLYIGEASWEARAMAVIGCIQDTEYKLQAILKAIAQAFFPLSPSMSELVKEGLAMKHPKVAELKEQCRLMELKAMLLKYEIRQYNMTHSQNAEQLVKYIVHKDLSSVMEDALQVAATYDHISDFQVYDVRMKYLIKNGRVDEIVVLLKSLPQPTAIKLAKKNVIGIELILNQTIVFPGFEKEMEYDKIIHTRAGIEMLKVLISLLTDASELLEYRSMLEDFINIHALQVEFGIFISYKNYVEKGFRKSLLDQHIKMFLQKEKQAMYETPIDVGHERKPCGHDKSTMTKLYRLCTVLKFPTETLRGQLALEAAQKGELEAAVQICRDFKHNTDESSAEILYQVTHALVKFHADSENVQSIPPNLAATLSEMADTAMTFCRPELLADCLELSKCVSLMKRVSDQCEFGQANEPTVDELDLDMAWSFEPYFKEDGLVLDPAIAIPMTCQFTMACLPSTDFPKYPYMQSRLAGCSNQEKNDQNKASKLKSLAMCASDNVQFLQEYNQLGLALCFDIEAMGVACQHMAIQDTQGKEVQINLCNERLKNDMLVMNKIVQVGLMTGKRLNENLLLKVFNQKDIDPGLAIGLLCNIPSMELAADTFSKLLKSAGQNYKKLLAIAKIGIDYAKVSQQTQALAKFQEIESDAKWGHIFGKLEMSSEYKTMEKLSLIPKLVKKQNVTPELLQEYCSAFKLDMDGAFLLYLEALFDPQTKLTFTEQQTRSQAAMTMLIRKDPLAQTLNKIMHQLDPYDYDVLEFILENIDAICSTATSQKSLKLVRKLSSYTRIAPPSDYELNLKPLTEEEQLLYGTRQLPPNAKERLPFHPFIEGDPWKIITPELNADTVDVWLPITNILKLPSDQVYLTAIQNTVKQHIQDKNNENLPEKNNSNWNIDNQVNMEMFETIKKMLMKVSSCEMAVSCARWVVQELPMGAEKVLALKSCVTLAQIWLETCTDENAEEKEKAKHVLLKLSSIFCQVSTKQVLYQNNLGEANLLSLAASPSKLIFTLYEHKSILQQRVGKVTAGLPDIHAVAEEIAKINKLSIDKIRMTLIEKWLPSSSTVPQADDLDSTATISFNLNVNPVSCEEEDTSEEENLKRVIYILQHGSLDRNAIFLLNFAFKESSEKISNKCRIRALQCLFTLVDKATIERLSSGKVEDIKKFMYSLTYLVELDQLHISHTVKSFEKCNKEGLARGIWRSHNHERRAVRLVCKLCLDYKIYDANMWNGILQQLHSFGMMDYLCHVLISLSGVPDMWQVKCLQKMWENVLLAPLTSAVPPLSEEQSDKCLRSIILLQRCPCMLDLDMAQFSKHYQHLEMDACALACLLMIPNDGARKKHIQGFLAQNRQKQVVEQLHKIEESNRILPLAKQVLQTVTSCSG